MANGRFHARAPRWARPAAMALFFLFFLLAFDRLLFHGLHRLAFQFYGGASSEESNEKWARSYERYQGIIFGTSRSRRGFNARMIGRILAGHVGMEAQGGRYPSFNLHFFRHLRPHLGRVRFVIYGIDYFIFGRRSNRMMMEMVRQLTRIEAFGGGGSGPLPRTVQPLLLVSRKADIEEFLSDLFNQKLGRAPGDGKGPGVRRGKAAVRRPEVRGRALPEPPPRWAKRKFPRFPGIEGRDFLKMLEELSREGIVTFLVFLPDHVGTNATNYEQEAFKAEFRGLAARFRSVHVLDFNDPKRFRLSDPDMFSDGGWGRSNSHLSRLGQRIFSRQVSLAIRPLLPAS
jgi:hypothetical protein